MTPADVRNRLIDALRTDLVGPALPDELLDQGVLPAALRDA